MGWHHADIAHQAKDEDAIRPLDVDGDSLIWKAGVLWARCPRWHLDYSPESRQAKRFVATVERVRAGVEAQPVWTAAGAACVDTILSLRSWFEADRIAQKGKG